MPAHVMQLLLRKGHHSIDEALCIECGACYDVCEYGSIFEAEPATMIPKEMFREN